MPTARVSRGRKSQQLLANWFKAHGWKGAESRPASLPGTDLMGLPGYAVECKATEKLDLTGALRQANKNAKPGETALVVYRPRGYGEEKLGSWIVAMNLDQFTRVMQILEGWNPDA